MRSLRQRAQGVCDGFWVLGSEVQKRAFAFCSLYVASKCFDSYQLLSRLLTKNFFCREHSSLCYLLFAPNQCLTLCLRGPHISVFKKCFRPRLRFSHESASFLFRALACQGDYPFRLP